MRQTENFKLSLFDGSDPVSMAAMNANTEAIDAALQAQAKKIEADEKSNAEQFGLRAKIATGSYVGTTATLGTKTLKDRNGKSFTQNFGAAVSRDTDLVIALDFVPRVFHVAASRSAYVSWSGTFVGYYDTDWYPVTYTANLIGYELQAVELVAHHGSEFAETHYMRRYPDIYPTSGSGEQLTFGSTTNDSEGTVYGANFGAYPVPTRVTFTENDDGTCTVTIHGTDSARATENYLDIEGMTYHWTAIG